MFNPAYYNPAYVGVDNQAHLAAHHRTQWAGYSATLDPANAPNTQLISVAIPAKGILSGIGMAVVNDSQIGLRSNQIRIQAAFARQIGPGVLRFGISPAFNLQTLDPGNFRPADPETFGTKQSQLRPTIHAGLFFQSNKRYTVGISLENINDPRFSLNGFDQLNYFSRTVNLSASKDFGITRDLLIRPHLLIRAVPENISGYSFNLSAIAEYQEKMWGGLAFNRAESISILVGYSFLGNNLKAGYSFDYIVSDREAKEPTSHEVYIRYNLPELIFGGRKAIKTPRFAF